ncbi:MAG: branched-chain amino acid transport system permease protein [Actinomycetota bacterium]|nr:branched-chain amino acid transport system permease protein [Actinomycetota bacterium]
MGQTLIAGLVVGGIYGILALGIVIVYRGSKVLNFAQAEIGTFGIYVAWWLVDRHHVPWLVGALAGVIVSGALSFAFERFVVRQMTDSPRVTVAVATVGLLLLLIAVEVKIWGPSPRFLRGPVQGSPFTLLGYRVSWTELVALALAAAVGLGLNAFLRRTDFGLGVLAAAQDPVATRMQGISYARVSAFTWVTAGVLGTLAVLLIEPSIGSFFPGHYSVGANALFIPALAAALIGRLDNLTHAFVGGLAVGVVQQGVQRLFIHSTVPGVATVAIFAVIIGALLLRTQPKQAAGAVA